MSWWDRLKTTWLERRELAKSNAEMVEKMIRIIREFSLEPATPDEARRILGIGG